MGFLRDPDSGGRPYTGVNPMPTRGVWMQKTLIFTPDTAILAAGDVVADTQLIDANFFRQLGGVAVLQSLHLLDQADQGAALDFVFLNQNQSLGAENGAPSISDTNAQTVVGKVSVATADYTDLGGSRIATKSNLNLVLLADPAAAALYCGIIVPSGTPTFTASSLIAKFGYQVH